LPLNSENSQRLLNHPIAQDYCILKHIAWFRRTSARKCCRHDCRIPFPIMGLSSARVRNQAEGEVGAKGGGSGPAPSSHTATDSNPPSGGRRGGGQNPQLNDSPKLPSPGGTKARQPNGRQSDAPQELAPDAQAMNPSRCEIGAPSFVGDGVCPEVCRHSRERRRQAESSAASARGRRRDAKRKLVRLECLLRA